MSGMDRDFPMTRTQRQLLVIGFAVMIAAGIVLFGGFLPGLKPSLATTGLATIQGHSYHFEYSAAQYPLLRNVSNPWNVTFYNVTFELWLTHLYSITGPELHGIGTEPNGTAYTFALGQILPNGARATFFLSPDLVFAVGWTGGWTGAFLAQLYVLA